MNFEILPIQNGFLVKFLLEGQFTHNDNDFWFFNTIEDCKRFINEKLDYFYKARERNANM